MDNLFFLEAKCVNTNKTFYIRYDKAAGGRWCKTYGVKSIPQSNTEDGSYGKMQINISNAYTGPQYKCPYCGNKSFVRCGTCKKITCIPSGAKDFKCAYCDKTGQIDGIIKDISGNSGIGQK